MYRRRYSEERRRCRDSARGNRRKSDRHRSRSRSDRPASSWTFTTRKHDRLSRDRYSRRSSRFSRIRQRESRENGSFDRSISKSSANSEWNHTEKGGGSGKGGDNEGCYNGQVGDLLGKDYEIRQDVGLGTFGRVLECIDHRDQRIVAVKVVRRVKRYHESAQIEADILRDVNKRGERGVSHCVILLDEFDMNGHYCLVFERMGCSLYDLLKRNDYRGFPLSAVRDFAHQLLDAVSFLHGIGLVHTDLKPENILLCDTNLNDSSAESDKKDKKHSMILPSSTRIKVIDFGGATYVDDHKSSTVNTRQYRAPEVILGLGWCKPSDMWSAGCIISELYQGELLFATHDNMEHLALMERCIGPFPRHMVRESPHGSKYFDSNLFSRWRKACSEDSQEHIRSMPSVEKLVSRNERLSLGGLLKGLLRLDPSKRLTANESLHHKYFSSKAEI